MKKYYINRLFKMSTDLIENFNNDSEFLQKLKITTNVFLKTNGFIVDEPDFNKFSSKEFVDWVEKKNSIWGKNNRYR